MIFGLNDPSIQNNPLVIGSIIKHRVIMYRFLLFLFLFPVFVHAQLAIPEQGGYWVHDEANVLSQSAKAELESMILAERDSTSNQIGVLIVQSLEGEVPEEYSLRVAEKWKIGQKGKDNGVLLLIALKEHTLRIESGYGMEGTLTDAVASRINRNEIAPRFRERDFDGGVKAGVVAIMKAVKGEYKNENPRQTGRKSSRTSPLATIVVIIIIIIIASRRNKRGGGGGGYWSSGGGFMGPMGGFGGGGSSDSGGFSGGDFGGGGGFGGGGSSDSW